MATPLATAFVRIRPDTSKFEQETKTNVGKAGRSLASEGKKHGRLFGGAFVKSTAGPIRGIAGVVGGPLAAGFAAVAGINVLGGFIADARESAKVSRLTAAAIKSTGGAAHISAGQVGALATAISNQTGKDDEAIQSGENLLLTFTNIRNQVGKGNDIFNQASRAIVDMTAALNNGEVSSSGLKASSIQLGKALNDPIKGVTALRKVGVSFTDQQTTQIKKLVESGHTLDAQKIILKELGKEFGGAAKASADPMERLHVIVGNLGESLGAVLLPALSKAASFIADKVVPAIQRFVAWLGPQLAPVLSNVGKFISTQVMPALQQLGRFIIGTVVPAVQKWLGILADALQPALKALGEIWRQNIKPALQGLFDAVQRNWPAFQKLATIILKVAGFILSKLAPVLIRFAGVWLANVIREIGLAITILGTLIRWLITAGAAIGRFAVAAAKKFVAFYQAARNAVLNVIDFFRKLPGRILNALGDLRDRLYNRGKSLITGFWDGIKAVWRNTIDWFKGLPSSILHALGIHSPPKWAIQAGKDVMTGILKGVIPGGKQLLQYAKDTVGSLATIGGGGSLLGRLIGGGGGAISGSAVQIGERMAASVGWTGAQWRALYDLWNNESGWNPLADNPTSTAFGIPQFIAGTARQYGVLGSTDAARQIAAGMQYISDAYGNPVNAWNAWLSRSPHWYKEGTPFVPSTGLAMLHRGEAVVPEKYNRRGMGGNTYNINIAVPPNANQHEIGRLTVSAIKAYERGSGSGWRK